MRTRVLTPALAILLLTTSTALAQTPLQCTVSSVGVEWDVPCNLSSPPQYPAHFGRYNLEWADGHRVHTGDYSFTGYCDGSRVCPPIVWPYPYRDNVRRP